MENVGFVLRDWVSEYPFPLNSVHWLTEDPLSRLVFCWPSTLFASSQRTRPLIEDTLGAVLTSDESVPIQVELTSATL